MAVVSAQSPVTLAEVTEERNSNGSPSTAALKVSRHVIVPPKPYPK